MKILFLLILVSGGDAISTENSTVKDEQLITPTITSTTTASTKTASMSTTVDFKSKLYLIASEPYLFKLDNLNESEWLVSKSHLHSSQLDRSFLSRYFPVQNHTNILLNSLSSRSSVCSHLKYCKTKVSQSGSQCILNLNLILYLTEANNTNQHHEHHFNQIKLVDVNVILNDLSGDYLHFERAHYDFNVRPELATGVHQIGTVRALSAKNSDLVRYKLAPVSSSNSFSNDQPHLIFAIDESSGQLTLNASRLTSRNSYMREFQFYVEAYVQCSASQKPLFNRTMVSIRMSPDWHSTLQQPVIQFNVTNLIESKTFLSINASLSCLALNQADMASSSIALAQVQIETALDYEMANLNLALSGVEPDTSTFELELRPLVDNLYVIYLINKTPYFSKYLNDLYKITLQFDQTERQTKLHELYLCLNNNPESVPFIDDLNLIQFKLNFVHLDASFNSFIELDVLKLTNTSTLAFLEDSPEQIGQFELVGNDRFRFKLKETTSSAVLARTVYLVAYDSARFANFSQIYSQVKKMSVKSRKQLHFATRVLVSYANEQSVDDGTLDQMDERKIFKLNTIYTNLINNSVVGYLPSIYELDEWNKSSEYSILRSNVNASCFGLNKFTGVLFYSESSENLPRCFSEYPIKLTVGVNSNEYAEVWIFKRVSPTMPVNLMLNKPELNGCSLNVNFELSLNNLDEKIPLPSYLNLVNFIGDQKDSHRRVRLTMKRQSDMFVIDSKRNSLFMTRDNLQAGLIDKCFQVDLTGREYEYLNSAEVVESSAVVGSLEFKLGVCFYLGQDENQTELISPLSVNSISNFESLIRSRSMSNYVPFLWYLTLVLFTAIISILILFLIYNLCAGARRLKVPNEQQHQHQHQQQEHIVNSSNIYENLGSKSYNSLPLLPSSSSSSPSSEFFNQTRSPPRLTIRSEPSSSFRTSGDETSMNRVDSNYGFVTTNMANDERVVPCKLDILLNKMPLSNSELLARVNAMSHELSSINMANNEELSDDHGVYCLATGNSFTSNISSVTNSQCVDNEVNAYFRENNQSKRLNKTRLSLFDLTPTPVKLTEIDQEIQFILNNEKWLASSFGERNNQAAANMDATEFNGECII
jgi:hypothetical protein